MPRTGFRPTLATVESLSGRGQVHLICGDGSAHLSSRWLQLGSKQFPHLHDPSTDKMVFIPHGMDLIFDNPTEPLEPEFRGTVARAVMETPQGRQVYRQRLKELGQLAYGTNEPSTRADELPKLLRP